MATDSKATGITTHLKKSAQSKLHELFIEQLQDLLWAEKKRAKAIGKMQNAATSDQLKQCFNTLHMQSKEHMGRLEQAFDSIGEKADTARCPAMAAIIDEIHDIIDETDEGSFQRDVALIIAAQKATHYEIASYGSLVQLAKTLGYSEAQQLLTPCLQEEKDGDALLTRIAKEGVNEEALKEPK